MAASKWVNFFSAIFLLALLRLMIFILSALQEYNCLQGEKEFAGTSYFRAFSSILFTASIKNPAVPEVLDNNTCVWIHLVDYGRSGNRLYALREAMEILSKCSGVATSTRAVNQDDTVNFPPVLFGSRGSISPFDFLERAAHTCKEVTYDWDLRNKVGEDCSPLHTYEVNYPRLPESSTHPPPSFPALFGNVFQERTFWQQRSLLEPFDTLVMYFRGGDILVPNPHPTYSQGPCSLFLEAWRLANVSRAMFIYDTTSNVNPCVEAVRAAIGEENLVNPPCTSVGCHLLLLAQAKYVALSGFSTFPFQAFHLLPSDPRIIFRYFCQDPPALHEWGLGICIQGETKYFEPWAYTEETRTKMLELPSQAVMGDLQQFKLREYLQTKNPPL